MDGPFMTVTLNEQTRELVEAELKEFGLASADELVNQIVQQHLRTMGFEYDEALEVSLIKALEGPRHVLSEAEFMERARQRAAGKSEVGP